MLALLTGPFTDYGHGKLRADLHAFGFDTGVPTTPDMIKRLYNIIVPPVLDTNLQVRVSLQLLVLKLVLLTPLVC